MELLHTADIDSELVKGLAVAGESGTLRDCPTGTSAIETEAANDIGSLPIEPGEVLAKTGTLDDVSALAGVTAASTGDVFTFAMIANGEDIAALLSSCDVLQRSILTALRGYPYGPSAADPALQPRPAAVTEPAQQETNTEPAQQETNG